MIRSSGLFVAALALLGVVATAAPADAALIAYICDDTLCTGGNDTIVTDQGPGDNFPGSATAGQINSGAISFNGFTIITNVTQSKPLIGSAAEPHLNLTFSVVTNDTLAHTIFLYATNTGFTGVGPLALQLGGNQGGTGAIRGRAWGGSSNTELDISGANLRADTGTVGTTPYDLAANGILPGGISPYSLTIGVTITRSTAGTTAGGLDVTVNPIVDSPTAVPEPATLSLLGLGLAGAAVRRRMRRQ